MSKWSKYAERASEASGSGLFLKLGDKQSIKFIVTDQTPHELHQLFPEGGGKPEEVEPGTPGAQVRFHVVIYDIDAKSRRIWGCSPGTFAKLSEKIGEFGEDKVYRVKRDGIDKKTKWEIDHMRPATEAEVKAMNAEDPIDLDKYGGRALSESAPPAKPAGRKTDPVPSDLPPDDEDIPF